MRDVVFHIFGKLSCTPAGSGCQSAGPPSKARVAMETRAGRKFVVVSERQVEALEAQMMCL